MMEVEDVGEVELAERELGVSDVVLVKVSILFKSLLYSLLIQVTASNFA